MKIHLISAAVVLGLTTAACAGSDNAVQARLAYLAELPEVEWVAHRPRNTYVGFSRLPADYRSIINAAAFHANKAGGIGAHVWAVPAEATGWKIGQTEKWYCCATARGGKVTDPCE